MEINLYPEMNSKISGLLRLSEQPAQMYAAALIDAYRASGLEPDEIPYWVPVSERLPETGKDYLVRIAGVGTDIAYHKIPGVWRTYDAEWDEEVTHWMAIPQPPRGEKP